MRSEARDNEGGRYDWGGRERYLLMKASWKAYSAQLIMTPDDIGKVGYCLQIQDSGVLRASQKSWDVSREKLRSSLKERSKIHQASLTII